MPFSMLIAELKGESLDDRNSKQPAKIHRIRGFESFCSPAKPGNLGEKTCSIPTNLSKES